MNQFIFLFLTLCIFTSNSSHAIEACSRIAMYNYQEILIDSTTSKKGEGLRPLLQKEPEALRKLEIYQKNADLKWPNAVVGSIGVGLIATSLALKESSAKSTYLVSGLTTMLLNFFISKTLEITNEKNLDEAISIFNKNQPNPILIKHQDGLSQTKDQLTSPFYLSLSFNF